MLLTIPQTIMVAILVLILVTTKNLGSRPAILLAATMTLLHMYDHVFLLKRGKEKKLTEKYCSACSGA
tara:strand:+ start:383 stop:586 length:204 start_codon:yes stop_codon:yes gene_type:complete